MRKVALITGITGQDGSYLAEFLIEKGKHQRAQKPIARSDTSLRHEPYH